MREEEAYVPGEFENDCLADKPGHLLTRIEDSSAEPHRDDDLYATMADLESQVISSLTATISERQDKLSRQFWPPLPVSPEAGCILFPRWLVVSIILLSIVGIMGAIFELRYQYRW